jgi:hypothetical protein
MEDTSVFVPNDMASLAIQQMQLFGWKLVGQEPTIYHEEPCLKLSFVRTVDLPSLDRIRELEDQYPFGELVDAPAPSQLVRWGKVLAFVGVIFLAFSCIGILAHVVDLVFPLGLQYHDWFSFQAILWGVIDGAAMLAAWWRWKQLELKRQSKYLRAREEVEAKRAAIEMELRVLFQRSMNSS